MLFIFLLKNLYDPIHHNLYNNDDRIFLKSYKQKRFIEYEYDKFCIKINAFYLFETIIIHYDD